jgi:hypothetical protein
MCISKKNKKGIIRILAIVSFIVITLIFYYYPQDNILKGYSFSPIRIDGRLADELVYNVKDKEKLSKEIISMLKEFGVPN